MTSDVTSWERHFGALMCTAHSLQAATVTYSVGSYQGKQENLVPTKGKVHVGPVLFDVHDWCSASPLLVAGAAPCSRQPTIDDEFEQYFSKMLL